MLRIASIISVACMFANVSAQAPAPNWGQCGGIGWTGPTVCSPGWHCTIYNSYHYLCLQLATSTTSTSDGCGATTITAPSGSATIA
ncbi:hypothetical protein BDZ94DRAFT_1166924 [Collybia nuda]|uniref:CBM1 domain-containing protein n=1 Tax=Collybia nuda TaxID=64659 RepID=A0A9P6CH37_9AGAR|nr:hypothetical protein BDZ94DRAFT_1166924 [Collybia nuda]